MQSNRELQLASVIEEVDTFFSQLRLWIENLFASDDANHFLYVPDDLIRLIIISMAIKNPVELANLMFVSKQFLNILNVDIVWKNLGFDRQQYQQKVAYNHRYNQVIKHKGLGVALADQTEKAVLQPQPGSYPAINLFLIGDGEVGQALECESFEADEIGYAYDGGAAMRAKFNGYHFTIRLCCDMAEKNPYDYNPQFNSLIAAQIKYRVGREMNINHFKRDISLGGAHLVLISLGENTLNRLSENNAFISHLMHKLKLDKRFQDKAIVFVLDDVPGYFNYSTFIKQLSVNHPDIAGRVIGMMKVEPYGDVFHHLVENLMPMLRNAAFACESRSILDLLGSDVKGLITEQLSDREKNSLACTSKQWYGFFHVAVNHGNGFNQPDADNREVCSIM